MGFETTIVTRILKWLNITQNWSLPVSLPSNLLKISLSCHPESGSSCLLEKASDLLYVDSEPPPSHSSHLILEQYQDSDLPLTSTEGTDTEGHSPHFITQRQAVVACQTIPLTQSQKPGDVGSVLNQPQLSARLEHPLSSQHPCTHVPACVMSSLRATPCFYSEEIGSPITLSSFLQLNTDQLMTTNETRREIHTGILEWCWESETSAGRWIINYELQLASDPTAERHFPQSRPYWYLLKLAAQAKVAGLI